MFNGNHNKQANEKSENIEIVKFGQFKKMGDNEPQKDMLKFIY